MFGNKFSPQRRWNYNSFFLFSFCFIFVILKMLNSIVFFVLEFHLTLFYSRIVRKGNQSMSWGEQSHVSLFFFLAISRMNTFFSSFFHSFCLRVDVIPTMMWNWFAYALHQQTTHDLLISIVSAESKKKPQRKYMYYIFKTNIKRKENKNIKKAEKRKKKPWKKNAFSFAFIHCSWKKKQKQKKTKICFICVKFLHHLTVHYHSLCFCFSFFLSCYVWIVLLSHWILIANLFSIGIFL